MADTLWEGIFCRATGDKEGLKKAKAKLNTRVQTLRTYCDDNGLKYKPDRTAVVNYKKSMAGFVPADKRKKIAEIQRKGLDISGGSGIIKVTHKASASQKPPDFSRYAVPDDMAAVMNVKQSLMQSFDFAEGDIDLQGIRNAETLEPFASQLIRIQKETGMKMPKIIATDVIDGDLCCIAGYKPMENRFYISSRYFNSKEALLDTLKEWSSKGVLPKQAKSLRYLAEHEMAHIRIPDELLMTDGAKKIWKNRKLLNDNDQDIFEYFADAVAIYRMNPNSNDSNIIKAIDYLRNGGVTV